MAEGTVTNNNNTVAPPNSIDYNNINELRQQADALVTYGNYSVMTNTIASLLAYKDAELTVKADPIALSKLRADLTLRNQQIMESIKNNNRIAFEEMQIKAGKYKRKGNTEEEVPEEVPEDGSVIDMFNTNPYLQQPTNNAPTSFNWNYDTGGNNASSNTNTDNTNNNTVVEDGEEDEGIITSST